MATAMTRRVPQPQRAAALRSTRPLALLLAASLAACGGYGDDDGDGAAPLQISIVSPAAGASVARGEGAPGAGSFIGAGFVIDLEIVTPDGYSVAAREGTNVRDTSRLGQASPSLPTLVVSVDKDLVKPDGTLIPKDTNLAALFNVAGSDDNAGSGVTLWAGWHVLESFPAGTDRVTITASVTDTAGRVATDRKTFNILGNDSGDSLTPASNGALANAGDGIDDGDGPLVTMLAPRGGAAIAVGPQAANPTPANGSLMFIQVSALDRTGAGIAVNENGSRAGRLEADLGTIADAAQIGAQGPNRSFPGLAFSFDVPLRLGNGNLVPAGQNLAPLFNIVGSERAADGVRTTAGWVVGGALVMPAGATQVSAVARVTDNAGRSGSITTVFAVSAVESGQALTPAP